MTAASVMRARFGSSGLLGVFRAIGSLRDVQGIDEVCQPGVECGMIDCSHPGSAEDCAALIASPAHESNASGSASTSGGTS